MKAIFVEAETLPEAFEEAIVRTWNEGCSFETEYDNKDRNDPPSKDVTAMIHIKHPFQEPRIHRHLPMGLDGLEVYRSEFLHGVHDHWIAPEEGKWEYTYHERLFNYGVTREVPTPHADYPIRVDKTRIEKINQIEKCIELLRANGHTRRAQAVTWQVWKDLGIVDAACLQRLWFRIERETCETCRGTCEVSHGSCYSCQGLGYIDKLNMNIFMRSNDLFKGTFSNIYVFTELQAWMADRLGVAVGPCVHVVDSLHLYGSYFKEIKGFLKTLEKTLVIT